MRDDADISIVTQATAKLDNTHLQMDESLFNPDSLWQRSTNRCDVTSLSRRLNIRTLKWLFSFSCVSKSLCAGKVDELGRFVSDFDAQPEDDKSLLPALSRFCSLFTLLDV